MHPACPIRRIEKKAEKGEVTEYQGGIPHHADQEYR
jgi:hypothetical protein